MKKDYSSEFWKEKKYSRNELHKLYVISEIKFYLVLFPFVWFAIKYSWIESLIWFIILWFIRFVINKESKLI